MGQTNTKWHRHYGIYGVCLNERGSLLVIEKNGGPYTGLWDLPGGSPENPESISQCLQREILEETGMSIKPEHNLGCFDILTDSPYAGCQYTHHIAILYSVSITQQGVHHISSYVNDNNGPVENDSRGFSWVDLAALDKSNASPLVLKARDLLNHHEDFDLIEFKAKNHS